MKKQINKAVDNIFKTNLGVKKTEKVVVFTDNYNKETRRIGKLVYERGKRFTNKIKFIKFRSTGCHGVEPPEEIWAETFGQNVYTKLKHEGLFIPIISKNISKKQTICIEKIIKTHKKESVNVIIALSYYSTTHTIFRDLLNRICGARYASMPLFDEAMLTGAMRVNWNRMKNKTNEIAVVVNRSENLEISAPNGTFISLSKKGREVNVDTGIITKPGSFSNLPSGEVFFAPLEGTAEGKLVLEWAPTHKLEKPITLHIERGLVKKVEGSEKYANLLDKKLSEKRENRNIAELGIGTNNKASRPDNILESEKILGTIHIAIGDNSSFGGNVRTSFHQDFVFFKPTVMLIYKSGRKRILLKNGKLSLRR